MDDFDKPDHQLLWEIHNGLKFLIANRIQPYFSLSHGDDLEKAAQESLAAAAQMMRAPK